MFSCVGGRGEFGFLGTEEEISGDEDYFGGELGRRCEVVLGGKLRVGGGWVVVLF